MRLIAHATVVALLAPVDAFVVQQPAARIGARPDTKPRHVMPRACAAPPSPSSDGVRAPPQQLQQRTVVLPKSDLLSAAGVAAKKKKKGIRSVTIGGTKIDFAHDMTNTFIWGGLILGMAIVKIAKVGKSAFIDEPNYKHIANTAAEETELHEFVCENCGFTMFPARGREGKFFPDDYKCLQCGAPKEKFFDMTDLSDSRTINAMQNDEDFDYEIEEIEVVVSGDSGQPAPSSPPTAAPRAPPAAAPPAAAPPPPPATPGPDDFDPLSDPLL